MCGSSSTISVKWTNRTLAWKRRHHADGPQNPNPNLITSHRKLIQQYIRLCHRVVEIILCGLEKQLGLLPATLIDLHKLSAESGDHVRFLKCPSQPANDRQTAVGEHTDFGSITVLFNRLAGLRVVEPGVHNEWENWPWVPPRSDHAIINLGDAMVKLTNGLFRSNVHRVDPHLQSKPLRRDTRSCISHVRETMLSSSVSKEAT